MDNWKDLEGYHNGAIYSRMNGNFYTELPRSFVFCTIPRLYTPHCSNELKAADDLYLEYKDAGIELIFGSTDSPEVAERYFGEYPVSFPFIRVNEEMDFELDSIDEFGDSGRVTYFIKDAQIVNYIEHDFNYERDLWKILKL